MEEDKFSCEPDLFSSDDEVFTLQCPDSISKDTISEILKGSYIEKTSTLDGEKTENFNVEVLDVEKSYVTIAVPLSTNLHRVPLKGHIIVQKSFKLDQNLNEKNINDFEENVRFPDDIKLKRHPLLGISWKAHLEAANKAKTENNRTPKDQIKERSVHHSSSAKRKKRKSSILNDSLLKKPRM